MALNTDSARLTSAAGQLEAILHDTLGALSRYVGMNQNITGPVFAGMAAGQSLATTEDVAHTGRVVSQRFEQVINQMRAGAHQYQAMEDQNRAALGSVSNT